MLTGAIAAAVTPLAEGGDDLDEEAIGPLTRFLAERGIDGVLACGTTGEDALGARTPARGRTVRPGPPRGVPRGDPRWGTVDIGHGRAGDAREGGRGRCRGRDRPALLPAGRAGLFEHLRASAEACGPLPFYVYEFAGRSGYAIPVPVIERLENLAESQRA